MIEDCAGVKRSAIYYYDCPKRAAVRYTLISNEIDFSRKVNEQEIDDVDTTRKNKIKRERVYTDIIYRATVSRVLLH